MRTSLTSYQIATPAQRQWSDMMFAAQILGLHIALEALDNIQHRSPNFWQRRSHLLRRLREVGPLIHNVEPLGEA